MGNKPTLTLYVHRCPICQTLLEWVECRHCDGEEGWFVDDEWQVCEVCTGEGGWTECPKNHKGEEK